jgi:hypothetical protein
MPWQPAMPTPSRALSATWLARYRRTVAVRDNREYRNRWADASHGYVSRDPVNPAELLARARADLRAYPTAQVRQARAVKAVPDGHGGFEVVTETGRFAARRPTGRWDMVECELGFFSIAHHPVTDWASSSAANVTRTATWSWMPAAPPPSPASSPPVTSPRPATRPGRRRQRRHRRRRLRPLSGKPSDDPTSASSRRRGRGRGRT